MATPTFGIFDHIEGIPGTPTPQLLKDRLDLVRMADQAGFTGYYLAEHHGSDLCMAPTRRCSSPPPRRSPNRSGWVRWSSCCPLHHPVRLVEDMCVVDNLTNGRLEFGVGRGVAPIEHYWFGSNWPESTDRFEDVLGIIQPRPADRRGQRRGLEVLRLPHDADGDAAGPAAHPVLVSGQSGHRRQVRPQPDVAGSDRRRVVRRSTSTPGTRTSNDEIRFDAPGRRAPRRVHDAAGDRRRRRRTALEVAERGDEGLDAAHPRRPPWDVEVLGEEAADAALGPLRGSWRTSTMRSAPAPARRSRSAIASPRSSTRAAPITSCSRSRSAT